MSLEIQKQLFYEYFEFLCNEGEIHEEFNIFKVYILVDKIKLLLIEVQLYSLQVNREISELESYSKLAKVNFLKASKIARSIKAKSVWIGAHHVKKASIFVIDACLGFNEESYVQAVDDLRNDFDSTNESLRTCIKMMQDVVEIENQKKRQKK